MSWSYLQEVGVGFMVVCYSDTLPYAPSRLSPKTASCSCNASETESCQGSLSGTMCEPSTASRGAELLTSSAGGSPAQTSALPAKAQGLKASKADSGEKWRASFARFDRDTCSWKTAQCSLLADSGESSVIWPRSGMTVGGLAYPLPTVGRRTNETGYGFWQTPVADDCVDLKMGKFNSRGEPKLSAQAKMFPTAKASDSDWGGMGELLHYVKTGSPRGIPTPRANDAEKRGNIDATNKRNGLAGFVRKMPTPDGLMNPEIAGLLMGPKFVEWLMGWPIGSTAFSPLEMHRFHEFMRQHGGC